MDPAIIVMWLGFVLAGYSVVGNDSIQTLGTFLSSNEEQPWYILWLFAGGLLTFTLLYGWFNYGGDVSYSRLEKYPFPENFGWPYLLPPLVLIFLTRGGFPVSTTFIILTFFSPQNLGMMVTKSVIGYIVAFVAAILLYLLITKMVEKRFIENPIKIREKQIWTALQWLSTGFLWWQWLIQDFANIYAFMPRRLSSFQMFTTLGLLLAVLAYIFYSRGGSIQKIVKSKTNTVDLRSATIIDFSYGLVLLFFSELNNVPMSTTWVFIGLLAGRELAIRYQLQHKIEGPIWRMIGGDLQKVLFGLAVSISMVYLMRFLTLG